MNIKTNKNGFTLVELLVTIVIIAILGSIAIPAYNSFQEKSRRYAAEAAMVAYASFKERELATRPNLGYPNLTNSPSTVTNTDYFSNALVLAYTFKIERSVDDNDFTFVITAEPTSLQSGDDCGTLSLDYQGNKLPTTSGCWK